VESIAAYISSDSPAYAKIVVKKIVKLTRQLARFPQSGREVPEFQDPLLRELPTAIASFTKLRKKRSSLPA
jgi:plasmid stabilization system protein ParE